MQFTIRPHIRGWMASNGYTIDYYAKTREFLVELVKFYHPNARIV